MYKDDLALNNILWLIRYKTKPNQSDVMTSQFDHHLVAVSQSKLNLVQMYITYWHKITLELLMCR